MDAVGRVLLFIEKKTGGCNSCSTVRSSHSKAMMNGH